MWGSLLSIFAFPGKLLVVTREAGGVPPLPHRLGTEKP